MSWLDWLIVLVPVVFVMYMGYRSRLYIRGVADFLSAGRICGRYVISVADVANGLSIITLVAFVEVHYKTGFAMTFWNNVVLPLSLVLSLTGYCVYRFRETKAMSLGQFLEMRYNRPLRIFAAALRSLSEMLANMICPAVAARFFIYFLDLPHSFTFLGLEIPTFMVVVFIVLTLAITIICMGGTLALVITDTIQGLLCYPMLVVFTVFVLVTFSWTDEIIPVMGDRIAGESFLSPYDISNLRDFNLFALIVTIIATILHRASWIGAGNTSAAKTPHEQKMANVLGTWRTGFSAIFYILLAVTILTLLNHKDFSQKARDVRTTISTRVAEELVPEQELRKELIAKVAAIPKHNHTIGVDAPLSQEKNLDSPYFDTALETLRKGDNGNARFQEFRTLYNQMMLPMTMRNILPMGMMGLFCLLMVLMMISTDDSRIYSAALTISQDVIVPFRKKGFTPEQHIWVIRIVSIGVGVFFFFGSFFMAQLDYINLFVTIMCSMWLGGCGPVMIFGLYSRFGTSAGAFASLLSGMFLSLGGIFVQRNWANMVYPWLDELGWVDAVGRFLAAVSSPFEPYILWRMDPIKFPINSMEIYFITMMLCILIYCLVSWITYRGPFNLDRMLHRGIYSIDGEKNIKTAWTFRNVFSKLIGITSEYTRGDKIIAWSVFLYSFVYKFIITFLLVVLYNAVSPWPMKWWGYYFLVVSLIVPGIVAAISTVWFSIGGAIDLRRLFIDLKNRKDNPLDDGRVEGNMSLADKAILEEIDKEQEEKEDHKA